MQIASRLALNTKEMIMIKKNTTSNSGKAKSEKGSTPIGDSQLGLPTANVALFSRYYGMVHNPIAYQLIPKKED